MPETFTEKDVQRILELCKETEKQKVANTDISFKAEIDMNKLREIATQKGIDPAVLEKIANEGKYRRFGRFNIPLKIAEYSLFGAGIVCTAISAIDMYLMGRPVVFTTGGTASFSNFTYPLLDPIIDWASPLMSTNTNSYSFAPLIPILENAFQRAIMPAKEALASAACFLGTYVVNRIRNKYTTK